MAKIKSIKCYNFVMLKGAAYMTFNIKFYDSYSQLIAIDFSNPIKNSKFLKTNEFVIYYKENNLAKKRFGIAISNKIDVRVSPLSINFFYA